MVHGAGCSRTCACRRSCPALVEHLQASTERFGAGLAAACFAHRFEQHCALSLADCLQANAEHFGPELPFVEGGSKRVLYPASNKASTELQVGAVLAVEELLPGGPADSA